MREDNIRGFILCKSTMPWTIINHDRGVNAKSKPEGGQQGAAD